MSHPQALWILWIGFGLASLASLAVGLLTLRRIGLHAQKNRMVLSEEAILNRLVAAAYSEEEAVIEMRHSDQPVLLAHVLCRALELVVGGPAQRMVDMSVRAGVEAGIKKLAQSQASVDRIAAVQLLAYLPKHAAILEKMAQSDRSLAVRGEALLALARMDQAPSPALWGAWMKVERDQPHRAIFLLLQNTNLITKAALAHAIRSKKASPVLRGWAAKALQLRDSTALDQLAVELLLGEDGLCPELTASLLAQISDPLVATQIGHRFAASPHFEVRVALCALVASTQAATLRGLIATLTSDTDWRVRTQAREAMNTLNAAASGGFGQSGIEAAALCAQSISAVLLSLEKPSSVAA